MTKQEYIEYRERNILIPIMYEYYKENRSKSNIPINLSFEDFRTFIHLYPHKSEALNIAISFYDQKFEITIITNLETQEILKIL